MSRHSSSSATEHEEKVAGSKDMGRKKGRRPIYKVLDLSTVDDALDKVGELKEGSDNSGPGSQDTAEKESDLQEEKVEEDDAWYDELDIDEEDEDERQREKRDKDQEYNLFVKSNQKRGHCTAKKSKRQRSSSR